MTNSYTNYIIQLYTVYINSIYLPYIIFMICQHGFIFNKH